MLITDEDTCIHGSGSDHNLEPEDGLEPDNDHRSVSPCSLVRLVDYKPLLELVTASKLSTLVKGSHVEMKSCTQKQH